MLKWEVLPFPHACQEAQSQISLEPRTDLNQAPGSTRTQALAVLPAEEADGNSVDGNHINMQIAFFENVYGRGSSRSSVLLDITFLHLQLLQLSQRLLENQTFKLP